MTLNQQNRNRYSSWLKESVILILWHLFIPVWQIYVFKRGLPPNHFRDMFTLASQLHSHYTRNCNVNFFYIPTNIRNLSIRFQEPKFFNSITPEIQNSESIHFFCFFKRLKKSLLSLSNILFVELHTSSFLFFCFVFYF